MSNGGRVPRLETDRLILRAHGLDDLDACHRIWCQEEVYRHISGKPASMGDAWGRFLRFAGLWHYLGYGYWLAEDKATGQIVGDVGFADFKRNIQPSLNGVPEAGWVLAREFHGQGMAREACDVMLEWMDNQSEHDQTCCIIHPKNETSIKLAERLGYDGPVKAVMDGKPEFIFYRPRSG